MGSKRHIDCGKSETRKYSTFFADLKKVQQQDLDVICAETLFSQFLVEHNIALSANDCAAKWFNKIFPGSCVARHYGCCHTKTTAILKCCAQEEVDTVASSMRSGPFIIGTDGSQEGGEKLFPVVVSYIDQNGEITTKLAANPTCSEYAGENIFHLIDETFSSMDVGWNNCLALVCDNCNTMTGKNKGVISFVREKVPQVHLADPGCSDITSTQTLTNCIPLCVSLRPLSPCGFFFIDFHIISAQHHFLPREIHDKFLIRSYDVPFLKSEALISQRWSHGTAGFPQWRLFMFCENQCYLQKNGLLEAVNHSIGAKKQEEKKSTTEYK